MGGILAERSGRIGQKTIWVDGDVHAKLAELARDQRYKTLGTFINRVLRDFVDGKIVESDSFTTIELIVELYAKKEIDEHQLSVLLEKLKSGDLSQIAVSRRSRLILRPLKGPSNTK
jgi:hypothetical protein